MSSGRPLIDAWRLGWFSVASGFILAGLAIAGTATGRVGGALLGAAVVLFVLGPIMIIGHQPSNSRGLSPAAAVVVVAVITVLAVAIVATAVAGVVLG